MVLLTVKQYGFCFSNTTANVLKIIVESVYEAIDKNVEAPALALEISKTFDQDWHNGIFDEVKPYGMSGRIIELID